MLETGNRRWINSQIAFDIMVGVGRDMFQREELRLSIRIRYVLLTKKLPGSFRTESILPAFLPSKADCFATTPLLPSFPLSAHHSPGSGNRRFLGRGGGRMHGDAAEVPAVAQVGGIMKKAFLPGTNQHVIRFTFYVAPHQQEGGR